MNLNRKVIIIAEAGVNHNGSLRIAKKLVDKAVEAKADFIKFQTFNAGSIATIKSSKANYQKKNSSKSETQLQMLKKLELNEKKLRSIYSYCKNKKIGFMSSPFDLDSLNILKNFKMKFLKIPSGEITNLPLLEEIGKSKNNHMSIAECLRKKNYKKFVSIEMKKTDMATIVSSINFVKNHYLQ